MLLLPRFYCLILGILFLFLTGLCLWICMHSYLLHLGRYYIKSFLDPFSMYWCQTQTVAIIRSINQLRRTNKLYQCLRSNDLKAFFVFLVSRKTLSSWRFFCRFFERIDENQSNSLWKITMKKKPTMNWRQCNKKYQIKCKKKAPQSTHLMSDCICVSIMS